MAYGGARAKVYRFNAKETPKNSKDAKETRTSSFAAFAPSFGPFAPNQSARTGTLAPTTPRPYAALFLSRYTYAKISATAS